MKHIPVLLALVLLPGCKWAGNQAPATSPHVAPSGDGEIIYHVFQRSFYDGNGDGHGDLKGFTRKLDYLKELGVTSVLMLPLYKSLYHHNYFPDDFKEIDPEYGTLADYLEMVKTIHRKNLKFYMDMEVQYVTEHHPWFRDSFQNPSSAYSRHVRYNGPGNTRPETMIFNLPGLQSHTGESLRITTVDLGHEAVRKYVHDLFAYWVDPNRDGNFEDGVDGFRIDHMMDDLDNKGIWKGLLAGFWAPLIKELKAVNPRLKFIAEQADWNDFGEVYFAQGGVDMLFAFSLRNALTSFDKTRIIHKADSLQRATPAGKNQVLLLENHDMDRLASVVGGHPDKLKFCAAFALLSKGVPLLYYGQELGMRGDGGFGIFGNSDGNDIPMREAFEWYASVDGPGMPLWYRNTGPWWDKTNLKANDGISYQEQVRDPASLLSFYKNMINVRKSHPAFTRGSQQFLSTRDEVIVLCRWSAEGAFVAVFNPTEQRRNAVFRVRDLPVPPNKTLKVAGSHGAESLTFTADSARASIAPLGFGVWKIK